MLPPTMSDSAVVLLIILIIENNFTISQKVRILSFGSIYFPSRIYAHKCTIGVLVSIWSNRMCVKKHIRIELHTEQHLLVIAGSSL